MEEQIFRDTGIRNDAEIKRKAQTLIQRDQESKSKGCGGLTDLQKAFQRLTRRTVKFIRWVEKSFRHQALLGSCNRASN
jgi:hypothetical protein